MFYSNKHSGIQTAHCRQLKNNDELLHLVVFINSQKLMIMAKKSSAPKEAKMTMKERQQLKKMKKREEQVKKRKSRV